MRRISALAVALGMLVGFALPAAADSAFSTVHQSFDIPVYNACTGALVNMHVEADTEFLGLFQDGSGQWHDTVRWTNTYSETEDGFYGAPVLNTTNVSVGPFEDGMDDSPRTTS